MDNSKRGFLKEPFQELELSFQQWWRWPPAAGGGGGGLGGRRPKGHIPIRSENSDTACDI